MEQFVIVAGTLFFPPLLALVALVLILATFGKSLGIRRRYVQVLIRIFEWGARLRRVKEKAAAAAAGGDSSEASDADLDVDSGLEEDQDGAEEIPRSNSGASGLIRREAHAKIDAALRVDNVEPQGAAVWVDDSLDYVKAGMESIIEDEVTSRFSAEELASWNMLSRTSEGHQFHSLRLTLFWVLGFLFRYFVLFPARMMLMAVGLGFLLVSTAAVGYLPTGELKRRANRAVTLMSYRILGRCISAIITYHDPQNQARPGGICVANHTSPIDVIILSNDNCYALVGQRHGGILGLMQRALHRASSHIWFERAIADDRAAVARRLREHVADERNLPILIFPEGTCINNTSVMQFKKGSFEICQTIYPVAVKYDPRFGDPFWNSSKQGALEYLIAMMTSWAIVADVWYLPPMHRQADEDAIAFANRVKAHIAKKGGLVDLEWDGQLKRYPVSQKLIQGYQRIYSQRIQSPASRKEE